MTGDYSLTVSLCSRRVLLWSWFVRSRLSYPVKKPHSAMSPIRVTSQRRSLLSPRPKSPQGLFFSSTYPGQENLTEDMPKDFNEATALRFQFRKQFYMSRSRKLDWRLSYSVGRMRRNWRSALSYPNQETPLGDVYDTGFPLNPRFPIPVKKT